MALQQLNQLMLAIAISIASFEVTFFVAAGVLGLTQREIALGILTGATSGLSVLLLVLWQSARKLAPQTTHQGGRC